MIFVNSAKSKIMVFRPSDSPTASLSIYLNGSLLQLVHSVKFFGKCLDNDLKFSRLADIIINN